jgi:mRNA-degrading endonuclease RelE of RelBE toxin-antitoxin system
VKSKATPRFWKLYSHLPAHVQKLARKNYALWKDDHAHPSLHFKKLKGGSGARFSVRIGDHYRAIGQIAVDCAEWVWIGTHEEYNRLT